MVYIERLKLTYLQYYRILFIYVMIFQLSNVVQKKSQQIVYNVFYKSFAIQRSSNYCSYFYIACFSVLISSCYQRINYHYVLMVKKLLEHL